MTDETTDSFETENEIAERERRALEDGAQFLALAAAEEAGTLPETDRRAPTADDLLGALPVGALVERLAEGWRVSLDNTGTKSGTGDTIALAVRSIGATREHRDGVLVTVAADGSLL